MSHNNQGGRQSPELAGKKGFVMFTEQKGI